MSNTPMICFKCLRSGPLEVFKIPELGAGSFFYGLSTEIHLCPDCLDEQKREWLKLEVLRSDQSAKYRYEDDLLRWITDFPPLGQERFHNRYAFGWRVRYLTSKEWLSRYQGSESIPSQKESMKSCEESFLIVYPDGRKRLDCPFSKDGTCANCSRFITRTHAPQQIEWNQVKEFCSHRYDAIRRFQETQELEQQRLGFIREGEC